jgi:hypothetical protein
MVIMTTATPPTSGRLLIQHQQERRNNDVIRMRLLNNLGIQRKETNLLLSSRASIEGSSKRRKSSTAQPNQQSNNNSNADYSVPFSTRLTLPLVKSLGFSLPKASKSERFLITKSIPRMIAIACGVDCKRYKPMPNEMILNFLRKGAIGETVVDRNDVIVKSVVALSIA